MIRRIRRSNLRGKSGRAYDNVGPAAAADFASALATVVGSRLRSLDAAIAATVMSSGIAVVVSTNHHGIRAALRRESLQM
jgi:hypothetical protein